MKKFAKICNEWLMRGWDDPAFALVNTATGEVRPFDDRLSYVAKSCDGRTDFNSPLFLPVHHKILDTFFRHGIAKECKSGDTIDGLQQFAKAENPYIAGIHWSITGRCNLNCSHCYMEAPGQRYRDMDKPEIDHVMDQFMQANVMQVSITGGEPFFRKDLFSILQQLTAAGIRVRQFYTNGLLVTDQILQRLKSMGLAPEFCISFDGCGFHDRMRGQKNIEHKTIDAMAMIARAGFPVNVATSIDDHSKGCLPETYEMLKSLDIKAWQVAPPNNTGNWSGKSGAMTPAEELEIYKPILKRWTHDNMPFGLQLGAYFNSKIDPSGDSLPQHRASYTQDSLECGVCRLCSYLLPDGTLLPCHGFTGTGIARQMPNLNKQSLAGILTDSVLTSFSKEKKRERLDHNPKCRDCDLFERCGMGCRAKAYTETGDINARDLLTCELMKARPSKRKAN